MSNPSAEEEANVTDYLKSLGGVLIICGDLNLKYHDWHSTPTGTRGTHNRWSSLVEDRGLHQLVGSPTHLHDGILDVILTNCDDISEVQVSKRTVARSDHFPVTFKVSLPHKLSCVKRKFRNYHNFNTARWCELFRNSGVESRILACSNSNEANSLLVNEINQIDNAVIPLVEIRFDRKTPWNSRSLRKIGRAHV